MGLKTNKALIAWLELSWIRTGSNYCVLVSYRNVISLPTE